MAILIIGISEMVISDKPEDTLVTYSLGSCLGVAFYDQTLRIGGMVHCMLPLSQVDPHKAVITPCMFVDTGVPKLLDELLRRGCQKHRLITKIAGASSLFDHKGLFRIGQRNYTVFRKILWKNSLLIAAEDIGGEITRTLRLEIATGRCVVKSGGKEHAL